MLLEKKKYLQFKNIYLEENKNGNMNDLFKKNLGSINNKTLTKNKSIFERKILV